MKILVVDGNIESAESISSVVTQMGHEAAVAYTAAAALELASQMPFDVLLCNVNLPDGDGLELSRKLRAEGAFQDARMIAVTGRTDLGCRCGTVRGDRRQVLRQRISRNHQRCI